MHSRGVHKLRKTVRFVNTAACDDWSSLSSSASALGGIVVDAPRAPSAMCSAPAGSRAALSAALRVTCGMRSNELSRTADGYMLVTKRLPQVGGIQSDLYECSVPTTQELTGPHERAQRCR